MEIKNNKIIILLLIISPYLYLFPHSFHLIEMGNDFELLYFSYKKYIFEFIRIGHFPFWSPSEGLGYSLIYNPFAQYFYPLSWILYAVSFVIGDLSKHTYLLYTIFGLSIYNLGQYFWLRKLNFDKKYCLVTTLIICFGLKLTELLRFPNAIHAFAWFPWILYSISLSQDKSKIIKSAIITYLATLMILSAGYPYYIFYGLILFTFYFVFINLSTVKKNLLKNKYLSSSFFLSFLVCSIPALLGLITIFPWFLGINELMEITRDRNLNDIEFSYTLSSNLIDQIGSWILPPISFAESNYYLGSIITISIIYYLLQLISKNNISKIEIYYFLFFLIFFIFNYQFAAAEGSWLFKIVWNKFEFIRNFRAFGRMNILLIPLLAIFVCFAIKHFDNNKINNKTIYLLFIATSIIIVSQVYLLEVTNSKSIYWETWQEKRLNNAANNYEGFSYLFKLYNNYIYSFFFALSFLGILFFKLQIIKNIFLIIISLVVCELFILSNIQWAIPYKYYDFSGYNKFNNKPDVDLKIAFESSNIISQTKGNTYFRNNKRFNINYVDQLGMDKHSRLIDRYFDREGEILVEKDIDKIKYFFAIENNARKVFFSNEINFENIPDLVDMILQSEENNNLNIFVNIDSYNGDKIEIEVYSEIDGYVIFVDNWSPGWRSKVNGSDVNIFKVLGAYKAVKINKGDNKIIFEYLPW